MSYIAWEQSVRSEPEVAPDAWIDRLLAEVERLPPASPLGGSDLPTTAIDYLLGRALRARARAGGGSARRVDRLA